MILQEKLIRVIEINAGLELKLVDASRKVAGDRWQVCMIARMDIPVECNPLHLSGENPEEFIEFQNSFGRQVRFEKKLVRNFIDGQAKEAVFDHMANTFLNDSFVYLSHRDFARKFVLKRFNEYRKLKKWGRAS